MNKIYIKNFKGFTEQIIEIEDINFLVGENSTGKTSLINLINILSSQEFWFNNQFNNSEIEMGYFEEIISKNATEKTFQIGTERIESSSESKTKNERVIRILFDFKSEKSTPKINWIKYSKNDFNVFINPKSKQLKCTYNFNSPNTFEDWIKEGKDVNGTTINYNLPAFRYPIQIIFQLIKSRIKDNAKNKVEDFDFDECLLFKRYTWLAPIRAKAKRIYESYNIKFSPEGEHIPSLLKSLLSSTKNKLKIIDILQKFGKESNLFDTIDIKELGDKNVSPFEILIKYNNKAIKLPNVGYGVSQILPLLVEILAATKTMFAIQQPEVHLHPKAQAAFGHFLFKACQNDENRFIIETHSDYTINRFRYCLSKDKTNISFKSQVLFFERKEEGNQVIHLKINQDGTYKNSLPESYRDFFIDEELKLLEL